jgi:hypothetical protein
MLRTSTNELAWWIHVIAGSSAPEVTSAYSERVRNAGATCTPVDSLKKMSDALTERTYGRVVLLVDGSLVPNRSLLKQLSDARGKRQSSVPILIIKNQVEGKLPENIKLIDGSRDTMARFNQIILAALKPKQG